jgi:hypothetical protein
MSRRVCNRRKQSPLNDIGTDAREPQRIEAAVLNLGALILGPSWKPVHDLTSEGGCSHE